MTDATSNDLLHRFRLERAGVRGAFVRLERTWRDVAANADYPAPIADLLGQALAASALFTSAIKFDGRLSVQLQSGGDLRLLFAECSNDGFLRGIARWDESAGRPVVRLGDDARLAITIENRVTDTRYQGMVPVEGEGLGEAFERYFERSEQLPTRILLATGDGRCGGLLLQQVAREGGEGAAADDDAWNRVGHLLATATRAELLGLAPEELLLRLFHEEAVRLEPAQPLAFACSCSRERVEAMLQSLGRAENEETLREQGSVEVHCEFCNRRYVFDADDVAGLFGPPDPLQSETLH